MNFELTNPKTLYGTFTLICAVIGMFFSCWILADIRSDLEYNSCLFRVIIGPGLCMTGFFMILGRRSFLRMEQLLGQKESKQPLIHLVIGITSCVSGIFFGSLEKPLSMLPTTLESFSSLCLYGMCATACIISNISFRNQSTSEFWQGR